MPGIARTRSGLLAVAALAAILLAMSMALWLVPGAQCPTSDSRVVPVTVSDVLKVDRDGANSTPARPGTPPERPPR
jgi:hypothetical protein